MENVAEKAGSEVEALNVELEAPSRIRLIEDALVPQTRDEKKRYMMIGVLTIGSFFGGIIGIAFLELQSRKVELADEVPIELGLTVVGALPVLPSRAHRGGAIARRQTDKDRLLAEPPARIGRRDPDHAGARGPYRFAPSGDDRQRRRRRGEDFTGELPGDQPGAERTEDPAGRRRSSQALDPLHLRPAAGAGAQRTAPRRGRSSPCDRCDPDRESARPHRGALRSPDHPRRSPRAVSAPCSVGSRSDSIS